ncbi:MAG: tyrosine-type recombinase/integrase [Cyclobacteriaceae bacterium]
MASIKIVLRKEKQKKDGTYPLAIRIIKDRKPKYIHIDHSIQLKHWDADERRVKKSHPNAKQLNNFLLKKLSEANDKALEAETKNDDVSSKDIKKSVKRKAQRTSFFKFGAERVKRKYLSKTYSVAQAERSILHNIEEFVNMNPAQSIEEAIRGIKERRKQRISRSRQPDFSFLEEIKVFEKNSRLHFEDINQTFINEYKAFCKSHLEVKPRTITNQLIFIRTLFNEALTDEIVEAKYYPFAGEKEKIRIPDALKIGLTKEEVERIENLELEEHSEIWHARNVWLLSFYFAGVRISDFVCLTWDDFKNARLFYVMGKNNKGGSLPVPEKAQVILDHYKSQKQSKSDFVFPYMKKADLENERDIFVKMRNATSLINDHLKIIAKRCGIDKALSNHIARHTFGNLAGDKIHPVMLQKLYRHSDLRTTVKYQGNFINKEADDALLSVIN